MIAEVMGKSPSLISKVINGKAVSYDVSFFIAQILDRPVIEVFPNAKRRLIGSELENIKISKKKKLERIYNSNSDNS